MTIELAFKIMLGFYVGFAVFLVILLIREKWGKATGTGHGPKSSPQRD